MVETGSGTTPAPHIAKGPVISSCMVGNVSTVYWVNKDNFLRSFSNSEAKNDDEVLASADRKDYQPKSVAFVNSTSSIKSKTRDIAALSFLLANPKDTVRSRLYYIDDSGCLAELRQDNSSSTPATSIVGWQEGTSLKKKAYKVMEGSPITTHMSVSTNAIKVYYYPKESPQNQWVAWWVGDGSEKWDTQPLIAPQN